MNTFLKTHLKLASFSHRIFMKFHDFFGIDFRIDFFIVFWWKWLPKWTKTSWGGRPKSIRWWPFSHLFRDLVFYVEFGSLWAPFWFPLAHFWLPLVNFWLPLAPFGSLLAHSGSLLAHFWCPLAHFCSPGVSIFSLLLYTCLLFDIFRYFPRKYHAKSYF